jgi:hypothetical protein
MRPITESTEARPALILSTCFDVEGPAMAPSFLFSFLLSVNARALYLCLSQTRCERSREILPPLESGEDSMLQALLLSNYA